ncbi:hypothetical protein, partial [Streptosporangium sp. NPDC002607]
CAVILSGPLFRVKPARFEAIDLILQVFLEFGGSVSRATPQTYQHLSGSANRALEPWVSKGLSADTTQAIRKSPE